VFLPKDEVVTAVVLKHVRDFLHNVKKCSFVLQKERIKGNQDLGHLVEGMGIKKLLQ
jgi:hypothetical protein